MAWDGRCKGHAGNRPEVAATIGVPHEDLVHVGDPAPKGHAKTDHAALLIDVCWYRNVA